MNYTTSGRRKKKLPRKKSRQMSKDVYTPPTRTARRETPDYPSFDSGGINVSKVDRPKSNHTVAPAYNKGAYQLISKSNIKDIGK